MSGSMFDYHIVYLDLCEAWPPYFPVENLPLLASYTPFFQFHKSSILSE